MQKSYIILQPTSTSLPLSLMGEKMRIKSLDIIFNLNVRILCCLLLQVLGNIILYLLHPPSRPQQWESNLH